MFVKLLIDNRNYSFYQAGVGSHVQKRRGAPVGRMLEASLHVKKQSSANTTRSNKPEARVVSTTEPVASDILAQK